MRTELKQLKMLFQFWMFLFAIGAIVFFVAPDHVLQSLNLSTRYLPLLHSSLELGNYFWLPLAVSLMVVLVFLCYLIVQNIEESQPYVIVVLLSKSTSSLVFFFFFVRSLEAPMFWGALTDGLIFIVTFIFYKRALNSGKNGGTP